MVTDNSNHVPLIGMPARMDQGSNNQYLSRFYADAVYASGGTPVILPLLESPDGLRGVVEKLDGILLTGSESDVDPVLYGAERREKCGPAQPLRDRTDLFLLRMAEERRVPVLGICYGMQSLNVHLGGSLVQDIPSQINGTIRHSRPRAGKRPVHAVSLMPDSVLARLAGATEAAVNSTHHQAVDRLGRGLEVIARAPDGVVEAVIMQDPSHWILAVQWHPEKSFSYDAFSRKIFDCFLAVCRAQRRLHEGTGTQDARGDG